MSAREGSRTIRRSRDQLSPSLADYGVYECLRELIDAGASTERLEPTVVAFLPFSPLSVVQYGGKRGCH